MTGILTSMQASAFAVTGHLCPKTDVVLSKWIAMAAIVAVLAATHSVTQAGGTKCLKAPI
jgi:hypothetical protein